MNKLEEGPETNTRVALKEEELGVSGNKERGKTGKTLRVAGVKPST